MVFHMNDDLNNTKTAGKILTSIKGEYSLITDEIRQHYKINNKCWQKSETL